MNINKTNTKVEYTKPTTEIIKIEIEGIIATSGGNLSDPDDLPAFWGHYDL